MRNVLALLALVITLALHGSAFGQMTRESWVNANTNVRANPNPPAGANEKAIYISGSYDCGREQGQTNDNLPNNVKVLVQRVITNIVRGQTQEIITDDGEDTIFPNPSTGTYSSKNFYL